MSEMNQSLSILSINGLSVRLPDGADREHAIKDVSLDVKAGEIHCVVGESGSGKSVSAQAVLGLLPKALVRASGTIHLGGKSLFDASDAELRTMRGKEMAMIFQEPMTALNPLLRLGHQVDEVLRIHTDLGAAARKARVLDVMNEVMLPDPATMYNKYPHEVSGGQRQRIMIAAALVLEPKLLIADEPTTALDVTTQREILRLIKKIQTSHQMGVLLITHDIGVVADIADRVTVMRKGVVIESGTTQDVLINPREDYTKMLIDAVPNDFGRDAEPAVNVAAGAASIVVDKVSKVFSKSSMFGLGHSITAVNDVSLTVEQGRTIGVVGESGSGKSTLARLIVRLETPTKGSITVGTPDQADREFHRKVQFVFQDPNRSLNPRRRVGDSIIEGPLNCAVDRATAYREAEALMERGGLPKTSLTRYPHEFSGGQRQRICIARALAMKPSILIADEAVSALDVSVQAQVLELLQDIKDEYNLTMLFITHDLRVAAQICDEIIVMKKGEIVEKGEKRTIFENPQHEYTKALLAAAPGKSEAGIALFGKRQATVPA